MKKTRLFVCFTVSLFLFLGCGGPKAEVPAKITAKRIIAIGLDGISVDGYQTAKHPNLDRLMADGTLSLTTRNVMPSVTMPNWTTHLTASGPEQHGVLGNDWKLDNIVLPAVETDADGYYPSIFKILKDNVPGAKTAFYYNWAELINSLNKNYMDEVSFEENDEYLKNYDKAFDFVVRNQNNPTLVFLYSVHTDHAGHDYGWMSPQYITSIEEVDVLIGKLIDKLKAVGLYEDTHFMFFTDHGGVPGKGHGGVTAMDLEVPWAITGPGIRKGAKLDEPNNSVNTARVMAYLFGCKDVPLSWMGEIPMSLFEPAK